MLTGVLTLKYALGKAFGWCDCDTRSWWPHLPALPTLFYKQICFIFICVCVHVNACVDRCIWCAQRSKWPSDDPDLELQVTVSFLPWVTGTGLSYLLFYKAASALCSWAISAALVLPMLNGLTQAFRWVWSRSHPWVFFFFFNVMKRQLLYQYLNSTRLLRVRRCDHLCSLEIESQFQMCPFSFPKSLLREKKALTLSPKWHHSYLKYLTHKILVCDRRRGEFFCLLAWSVKGYTE